MKIYSDRRFLRAGQRHVVMLYPFWGKVPEDPRNPASGRYDRLLDAGKSLFTMTALPDADVAVLPVGWEEVRRDKATKALANAFIAQARDSGIPVVIFFWSDSDAEVPVENALVFRTSFYRSTRKPNEFAMPAWSEDFVEKYLKSELPLRCKPNKPVVGFCGWAGSAGPSGLPGAADLAGRLNASPRKRLRRTAKRVVSKLGLATADATRAKALRALACSQLIEPNIVLRDRYLGAPTILSETQDDDMLRQVRLDFVQNMVQSDYILCARGTGNYSYRLYETLSMGRIPIIVDTDCVFPYDFATDWKQYCVWVASQDVSHISEIVAEFHDRLSSSEFTALQFECRRFWEEKLSPVGFFNHFHKHLRASDLEQG